MKERPIIMSAESVRAILADRKTQTRRVIKPQPEPWAANEAFLTWSRRTDEELIPLTLWHIVQRCPYGVPGDRLWVRETWIEFDRDHWAHPGQPRDSVVNDRGNRNAVAYRADTSPDGDQIRAEYGYNWRSPIHMPRWASRITLELTGVCVQRLQEISEEDARAEGMPIRRYVDGRGVEDRRTAFRFAWNALNGKRAPWASNPWVWALTFRRVVERPAEVKA